MRFSFKKLNSLRSKIEKKSQHQMNFLGLSLMEFNEIYNGNISAIIRFPTGLWRESEYFLSFFAATKMAFDMKSFSIYNQSLMFQMLSESFYDAIVTNNHRRTTSDRLYDSRDRLYDSSTIFQMTPRTFDYYAFPFVTFDTSNLQKMVESALKFHDTIKGDLLEYNARVMILFPKLYGSRNNDDVDNLYESIKESRKDDFMFFDYRREREIIDIWYMKYKGDFSDMFIDPQFDMKLMEPGLDIGYAYDYMASNYPTPFRKYANFNKEEVSKHMRKEDLRLFLK